MEFIPRNASVTPAPCSSGSPPCVCFSGHRQETGCHCPSSDPVLEGLRPVFCRGLPVSSPGPREATRRTARFTAKKCPAAGPRWHPVTCLTCWVSGENFTRSANFLFLLVLSAGFLPRSLFPSSLESAKLSPATQME